MPRARRAAATAHRRARRLRRGLRRRLPPRRACCACSTSTSCSPPPRRSAGRSPFPGKRLAILTNGGGVGVLAVDRLIDLGGALAELSPRDDGDARPRCCRRPGRARTRSTSSATRTRRATRGALEALLADDGERRRAGAERADRARLGLASGRGRRRDGRARPAKGFRRKPVFAVWLGEDRGSARPSTSAGIPHFATEADAVRGFMHLVRYREAQDCLMETPDSLPRDFAPDVATRARASSRERLARGPRHGSTRSRSNAPPARLRHPGRARRPSPRRRTRPRPRAARSWPRAARSR